MDTSQSIKRCTACGDEKPLTDFSPWKWSPDGLRPQCKECRAAYQREYRARTREERAAYDRRYYEENRERILEQHREYYEANREQLTDWQNRYVEENAGQVAAYKHRHYEENRERYAERNRRWKLANPDALKAKEAVRRALKRGAGGSFDAEDLQAMYEDQGGLCAYCECELNGDYHVDHMTPLIRGGSNGWENLAITCPTCNLRKNRKTVEEFMAVLLS